MQGVDLFKPSEDSNNTLERLEEPNEYPKSRDWVKFTHESLDSKDPKRLKELSSELKKFGKCIGSPEWIEIVRAFLNSFLNSQDPKIINELLSLLDQIGSKISPLPKWLLTVRGCINSKNDQLIGFVLELLNKFGLNFCYEDRLGIISAIIDSKNPQLLIKLPNLLSKFGTSLGAGGGCKIVINAFIESGDPGLIGQITDYLAVYGKNIPESSIWIASTRALIKLKNPALIGELLKLLNDFGANIWPFGRKAILAIFIDSQNSDLIKEVPNLLITFSKGMNSNIWIKAIRALINSKDSKLIEELPKLLDACGANIESSFWPEIIRICISESKLIDVHALIKLPLKYAKNIHPFDQEKIMDSFVCLKDSHPKLISELLELLATFIIIIDDEWGQRLNSFLMSIAVSFLMAPLDNGSYAHLLKFMDILGQKSGDILKEFLSYKYEGVAIKDRVAAIHLNSRAAQQGDDTDSVSNAFQQETQNDTPDFKP